MFSGVSVSAFATRASADKQVSGKEISAKQWRAMLAMAVKTEEFAKIANY